MSTEGLGASWEKSGYPANMGQYVLLRSLARGGMGEVHLAKHGGLAGIQKYCVVKTLKRFATQDPEYVRRFVDEARVVVSLQHKNICPVFDVGRVEGRYYLAMEFIAGRDLRALVNETTERGITIPPELSLFIMGEVLEALDYAHRARDPSTGEPLNLVHRDISPQNVMMSFEGEVKLIDFGLAASSLKKERTNPNVVMGKLAYMPPEQLDSKDVDGRADLFSAAVVLYELLAGERFYAGMTDGEILIAASSRDFVPRKLMELDPELQTLLKDALQSDRTQRLPDCGDLKDRLVRYQMAKGLMASSRDLRRMLERVFPNDQQQVRGMLAQHAKERAPGAQQAEKSQRIAVAPRAEPPDPPALAGIQELEGMSDSALRAAGRKKSSGATPAPGSQPLDPFSLGSPASETLDPFAPPAPTPGSEPLDPSSLGGPAPGSQPLDPSSLAGPAPELPEENLVALAEPSPRRDGSEPTEPTRELNKARLQAPAHAPTVAVVDPPSNDPFAVPITDSSANRGTVEATVVVPRGPRTGETPAPAEDKESRAPLFIAAAITLALVGGVGFFLTQRAGPDEAAEAPPPAAAAESAPAPPAAESAADPAESASDPAESTADDSAEGASAEGATADDVEAASVDEPEDAATGDGEDEAAEDPKVEAAAAAADAKDPALSQAEREKRAAKRRAARKKAAKLRAARKKAEADKAAVSWQKTGDQAPAPSGPPPKLRAGAKPEAKIRYLEMYCRKSARCANKLVSDFRGMRVEDAKKFWAKVDACVMLCSPGSLQ